MGALAPGRVSGPISYHVDGVSFSAHFMSILAIAHVWEKSKMEGSDLLVLLALADYANQNLECWPSVKTLSNKARVSERTCQYVLRKLEAEKEIEVMKTAGPFGCNKYRIRGAQDLHRGADEAHPGVQELLPSLGAMGCTQTLEPSIEPKTSGPSPAVTFREAWVKGFKEKHGFDYCFEGAKDGSAIQRLLKFAKPEELMEIVKTAWQQTDERKFWACVHQTDSIAKFAARLNQIRAELTRNKIVASGKKPAYNFLNDDLARLPA